LLNEIKEKLGRKDQIYEIMKKDKPMWDQAVAESRFSPSDVGNSFMDALYFTYLGPFPPAFRKAIVRIVIKRAQDLELAIADDYSFGAAIADSSIIDELLSPPFDVDPSNLENVLLMLFSPIAPYVIDPMSQSLKLIRAYESLDRNLAILKPTSPTVMRTLEMLVRNGGVAAIEDMGNTVDPALDYVTSRKTVVTDGKTLMKVGDRMVELDENFKLYLITRLGNPHLHPQMFVRTNVIYFTTTTEEIIRRECNNIFSARFPEKDAELTEVRTAIRAKRKAALAAEARFIEMVKNMSGTVLDDDIMVASLKAEKDGMVQIQADLDKDLEKLKELQAEKDSFEPVAKRIANMIEIASNFTRISPVYQFPYGAFKNLVKQSVREVPDNESFDLLLEGIMKKVTFALFKRIATALSAQHQLVWGFILSSRILMDSRRVSEDQWNLFIRGGSSSESTFENPFPDLIAHEAWNELDSICKSSPMLQSLPSKFISDVVALKRFLTSTPLSFPKQFFHGVESFDLLLVVKALVPQQISALVIQLIKETLGEQYLPNFTLDLPELFEMSGISTPLCFIPFGDANPRQVVEALAHQHSMASKLVTKSFGQNLLNFDELIRVSSGRGDWLFIQNLELSPSSCLELERAFCSLSNKVAHPDFRLFLSMKLNDDPPITLLQKSCLVNLEESQNLSKFLMAGLPEDLFLHDHWTFEFFCLSKIHADITMRIAPGSQRIPYQLVADDFYALVNQIRKHIEKPFDPEFSMWLIFDAFYENLVVDTWDRKALRRYVTSELEKGSQISSDARGSVMASFTDPTLAIDETFELTIQQLHGAQPREDLYPSLVSILRDIDVRLPVIDDVSQSDEQDDSATPRQFFAEPLIMIVSREADFFRNYLNFVRGEMKQLDLHCAGLPNMALMFDDDFENLRRKRIPKKWQTYPCPTELKPWVQDLGQRVEMLNNWIRRGSLTSFWLGGFSAPKAFLNALTYRSSKSCGCSVAEVTFDVEFIETEPAQLSDRGFCIHGLSAKGIRWNGMEFVDAETTEWERVPYIRLLPTNIPKEKKETDFSCPIYVEHQDGGMELLMAVTIPTNQEEGVWLGKGAAFYVYGPQQEDAEQT
jgi:dynein heavy chain